MVFTDAAPSDLSRPLDVVLLTGNEDDPDGFALQRVRRVAPRERRGRTRLLTPYAVERAAASVPSSFAEPAVTLRTYHGLVGPGRWRDLVEPDRPDESLAFQAILEVAFADELEWSVRSGVPEAPAITLPTDARGARAMFRPRDVPDGATRRPAPRHWVAEHRRRRLDDPEAEVEVREHRRGATTFEWSGLRGAILPSPSDLRRAEARRRRGDAERGVTQRRRRR